MLLCSGVMRCLSLRWKETKQQSPLKGTQRDGGPRAPMSKWLLANAMVYGLINVRTDGRKVVMGVLKEGESSFQIEEFTP